MLIAPRLRIYPLAVTLIFILNFSRTLTWQIDACEIYRPTIKAEYPICNLSFWFKALTCFGGFDEQYKGSYATVHTLALCDWSEDTFDPYSVLQDFPALRTFIISSSNFTTFLSPFPGLCRKLERINVTSTMLAELPDGLFMELSSVKNIDLRNNALTEINLKAFGASTKWNHVFLSGNPLKCTENMSWILDPEDPLAHAIVDKNQLVCAAPFEGRPLLPVVEIMAALKEECKKTVCDCDLVYVVGKGGKQPLMAFTSVNCTHRNLTMMPDFLPANTTTLHLEANKISDLTPLTFNPVYESVLDLYLDNNLVDSIVQLDGSYWLDHFRLLSLRDNKLTDLPTYALENVLLQSGSVASLYFGNNPWRCDCHFTPGFQDLLIRHPTIVKDINDVKCSVGQGDENSRKHIRDLTRTEICMSAEQEPWLYPLDILNIILGSLILLVLGKLLYDYWCFKKTGKLPWIVAKIP